MKHLSRVSQPFTHLRERLTCRTEAPKQAYAFGLFNKEQEAKANEAEEGRGTAIGVEIGKFCSGQIS